MFDSYKKLNRKSLLIFAIALLVLAATGCKKLVDVKPPTTRLLEKTVYANNKTAIGAVNAIFIDIFPAYSWDGKTGIGEMPLIGGLSADELSLINLAAAPNLSLYYQNSLTDQGSPSYYIWSKIYNQVYSVNDVIEGVEESSALAPSVKSQLLGEAKFLRGFFYFYLANLFGDVPLALTTNYKETGALQRAPQAQVFDQVIIDLKDAEELLSDNFLDGLLENVTTERVRPTKSAASALLAKVYLYTKKWDLAEIESTKVIEHASFSLDTLNGVFLKNSNEAIWQIQPTANLNTTDAAFFVLPDGMVPSSSHPTYLSHWLLESFEDGDLRKEKWIKSVVDQNSSITYSFPYKYKVYLPLADAGQPLTEYNMVLRLGEQYLIRAEARVQLNKLDGAVSDLDSIRARANLPGCTATSQTGILNAIYHERQVELFTEWGNRWFDLRRTDRIDEVMNAVAPGKATTWSNFRKYFPIDYSDILWNSKLTQTPGY